MARQGLPKKYAKMGFKRGWAAYKKSKRGTTRTRRRTTTRRSTTKRRSRPMARRKKYYTKARYGGGKFKGAIDGALAGAVDSFAGQFIPIPGVGKLAIGFFRRNQTLMTLGGYEAVASMLGGQSINTAGGVR